MSITRSTEPLDRKLDALTLRQREEVGSAGSEGPAPARRKQYEDFTWNPVGEEWRKRLLSNGFVIKDCVGDGNCQFRSIESALTNAGYKTNHERLRKVIGKYIRETSDHQFYEILQSYKLEKLHGDFRGAWDPFSVKSRRAFIKNLITTGTHFEGDYITLSLMSKAIGIDFVILEETHLGIIDLSDPKNKNERVIILHYADYNNNSGHYTTIGYRTRTGRVVSLFKRGSLPDAVDVLLDRKRFLLGHLQRVYSSSMKFSEIIAQLEINMGRTFSEKDKERICKLVQKIVRKNFEK
jgi:Txe/YoeB family toxin of Txe-Axe toxin-antitoxin module